MPADGAGVAVSQLQANEAVFKTRIEKMKTVDFDQIVRYLRREDKNHWTEEKALSELGNFKVFFSLVGIAKFPIVPTKAIDEVWHACILHTNFYVDLCNDFYGKYIHHRPSDGSTTSKDRDTTNFQRTGELFYAMTGRFYGQRCKDHQGLSNNCIGCSCDTCTQGSCDDDVVAKASTCCGEDCGDHHSVDQPHANVAQSAKCGRCSSCGAS